MNALQQWHELRRHANMTEILVLYQPHHSHGPNIKLLRTPAATWHWLQRTNHVLLGAWTTSGTDLTHG